MTNPMFAVFGLGGGELVLILAALLVAGMVLLGLGVLAFLIIRTLSRKSEPPRSSSAAK